MKNPVIDFYNSYDEDKRLTRKSHMPEYLITMKYVEKYLTENSRILEIGAGTGRYSIAFAQKGYDVTAVELAEHNIDIMKKKVKANHNIKIFEGNAVDLSFLPSDTFDAVLLLGPMYHLFTDDDKHRALSEAVRVAKKGAVIYVSYCNNDTCVYKMFYEKRILSYVDRGLIEENFNAKSDPDVFFDLYRKSDIDELMKNYNVTRLHFVGVDMLSYIFNNSLDRLNKKEFELYVKFIEEICEREDLVGFSMHMLDAFRKD